MQSTSQSRSACLTEGPLGLQHAGRIRRAEAEGVKGQESIQPGAGYLGWEGGRGVAGGQLAHDGSFEDSIFWIYRGAR